MFLDIYVPGTLSPTVMRSVASQSACSSLSMPSDQAHPRAPHHWPISKMKRDTRRKRKRGGGCVESIHNGAGHSYWEREKTEGENTKEEKGRGGGNEGQQKDQRQKLADDIMPVTDTHWKPYTLKNAGLF